MSISPAQCRAARGLINYDQSTLAEKANVPHKTIIDFETCKRIPSVSDLAAIHSAFESAGVQFISENGGGAGVRRRPLSYSD